MTQFRYLGHLVPEMLLFFLELKICHTPGSNRVNKTLILSPKLRFGKSCVHRIAVEAIMMMMVPGEAPDKTSRYKVFESLPMKKRI